MKARKKRFLRLDQAVFIYCRKEMKMTMRKFAKWLNIDPSLINKIEKGYRNPTDHQKLKLCNGMNKSYSEIKIQMIQDTF